MKKLTMILVAAAVLAMAPLASFANETPDQKIEKRIEHMKSKLGLDNAQVAKITTIYKQNESLLTNDRDAVKAAAKGSDAQKAAEQKMRADMQQVQSQIMPILTTEQQTKWKEQIAKHEGEHHGD
jgi:Spy/CpxP family protein refolding chaperone